MHSVAMRDRIHARSGAEFVRLSHLRKLCECEQVAAVCYRIRDEGIEFLLIRTRSSGRWTFPKGSAEPGLTHAQAAALEAFEEAGVHGRIEEASFASYIRRGGARKSAKSGKKEVAVYAHLCQVFRLSPPKESKRCLPGSLALVSRRVYAPGQAAASCSLASRASSTRELTPELRKRAA